MEQFERCTPPSGAALVEIERHYAPLELAKLWGFSVDKIRELFENEPDVLRVGHLERRYKRRYISLRIPESVVVAVHRRLQKAAA